MKHVINFVAGLIVVVVIACVMGSMTGCSVIQSKINADVQAVTVPDLQTALADAQAANDTDGAECWGEVLKYVQALPTASTAPAPHINGIASAIEAGRIAANNPTPTLPPIPHSLHKACAVLRVDAQDIALKFGIKAAALSSGLGIAKAGAQLSTQAAALKAEAAALGAHP